MQSHTLLLYAKQLCCSFCHQLCQLSCWGHTLSLHSSCCVVVLINKTRNGWNLDSCVCKVAVTLLILDHSLLQAGLGCYSSQPGLFCATTQQVLPIRSCLQNLLQRLEASGGHVDAGLTKGPRLHDSAAVISEPQRWLEKDGHYFSLTMPICSGILTTMPAVNPLIPKKRTHAVEYASYKPRLTIKREVKIVDNAI